MPTVLIIDDHAPIRDALSLLLDVHGVESVCASSPVEGLELVSRPDVVAVLQDMNFTQATSSGAEGVALFRAIRERRPDLPVILMTAWSSLETAVALVKEGATDYLQKPWDDNKLIASIKALLDAATPRQQVDRARAAEARAQRSSLPQGFDLCGLVYASDTMHALVSLAAQVAPSDASVLITGANGSGKEKLAEIVQKNSLRRDRPFVKVNAGALPDQLMESELFGAEAGAFTGASKPRVGRFEAAHGGTLFLDEVGNLSLAGQAKLLRVLQTGEFQRLGSNTTRKVDVRVISATNADLLEAIAQKTFREDLYFRLNVIELNIPPLRDRTDDLAPLCEHFLALMAREAGVTLRSLEPSVVDALRGHDWPGNVRELENRLRRALLVRRAASISVDDLGLTLSMKTLPTPRTPSPAEPERVFDRETLERALSAAGGNVSRAAADLGLSRQALYRKMDRLGLGRGPKGE